MVKAVICLISLLIYQGIVGSVPGCDLLFTGPDEGQADRGTAAVTLLPPDSLFILNEDPAQVTKPPVQVRDHGGALRGGIFGPGAGVGRGVRGLGMGVPEGFEAWSGVFAPPRRRGRVSGRRGGASGPSPG